MSANEIVTQIVIWKPIDELITGNTVIFKATCYDKNNREVTGVNENDISWSIGEGYDRSVVTLLNKSGSVLNVKCNKAGNILLEVRHKDGAFNAAYFEISSNCDRISSFAPDLSEITLNKGQTKTVIVTAKDNSDNKIADLQMIIENNNSSIATVQATGMSITITGKSYGTCMATISVVDCPETYTELTINVVEPPCFKIKETKVSGIININQPSTTIGAITLEKCSKGSFDVNVESDDSYVEVAVKTNTDQAINYGVMVDSGFLSANKCYSAKITFSAGSIKKVVPVYYYTFDPMLAQSRPSGCSGWTGMGSNASRSNSVPNADAPGSLNPSLVWSSLDYEVESSKHSPVIWNNRLIKMYDRSSEKGVECYDLATKNLLWRTEDLASGSENFRGPSIYKNYVFITINSKIIALDANDGSEIWSWSEYGEVVAGNPVISNDRVFSGGNKLRCHNLSTGYVLWEKESYGDVYADLTIQSGILSVLTLNKYLDSFCTVYAYDVVSGKQLWMKIVDVPDLVSVFGPNALMLRYFDKDTNRIDCYDSKSGNLKWKYDVTGETEWYAIPAVYDIYAILLNGKSVICLDTRNGKVIWQKNTQSQITNVPVIAGNKVYVCVGDEGIYTYDVKNGKLLANPFTSKPSDLYEWEGILPAEGTLIAIYSSGYNSTELCCYANNGRFKRMKVSALEMTVNSKTISTNNYNAIKTSTIAVAPQILNGVVCIPIKNVLDIFGGKLTKTGAKSYKINFGSNTLEVTADRPQATVNGKNVQIDPKNAKIVPKEVSGVLLVPSSFFATSAGLLNFWDNPTKTVIFLYRQIY